MKNEYLYIETMRIARQMLSKGLISECKYQQMDAKYKAKYQPKMGVLVSRNDLIQSEGYGNMSCEEET